MKIHLLRHADTENFAESGDDSDRVLIAEGRARALQMGGYLNERLSRKIAIYCSSSQRTRETAALIQTKFEYRNIQFKDELYHASGAQLFDFITELKDQDTAMIIGHNDGISDLANYLTGDNVYMDTCQYLCIELSTKNWQEVSAGTGRFVDNYRPELV